MLINHNDPIITLSPHFNPLTPSPSRRQITQVLLARPPFYPTHRHNIPISSLNCRSHLSQSRFDPRTPLCPSPCALTHDCPDNGPHSFSFTLAHAPESITAVPYLANSPNRQSSPDHPSLPLCELAWTHRSSGKQEESKLDLGFKEEIWLAPASKEKNWRFQV